MLGDSGVSAWGFRFDCFGMFLVGRVAETSKTLNFSKTFEEFKPKLRVFENPTRQNAKSFEFLLKATPRTPPCGIAYLGLE